MTDSVIGKKVKRRFGKQFKSGLLENTVTDVIMHPVVIGTFAFKFAEDDSIVATEFCEVAE